VNPDRQIPLAIFLAACAWSTVEANDTRRAKAQGSSAGRTVATPLRKATDSSTTDAIAGPNGVAAWVDPARCDQDGNLFFLLVPQEAPGPLRPRSPREIVGVSADGKSANHFDPGSLPALRGADELRTITTALDSQGFLVALVWVSRGRDGRQYIVTFDKSGRDASRLQVDPDEISVEQFEVFGTGELLLRGVHCDAPNVEAASGGRCVPRLAVMSGDGSSYRDVRGMPDDDGLGLAKDMDRAVPLTFSYMARGGDGRVYVARNGRPFIYSIDASGRSQAAFPLAPTSSHLRLAGLRASGRRLVAAYNDGRSRQLRWWLAVYDVALGQRMGLYGPVDGYPLCYEHTDAEDRFTVLRDVNRLVTLSP